MQNERLALTMMGCWVNLRTTHRILQRVLGVCLIWQSWNAAHVGMAGESATTVAPLLKLLKSDRLPEERTGIVIEMICKRGQQQDLQVVVDRVFGSPPCAPELQQKVLEWLIDAAVTRKVRPDGDRSFVHRLLAGPGELGGPVDLQLMAIRLAVAWREEDLAATLLATIANPATAEATLHVAVEGLGSVNTAEACDALRDLAQDDQRWSLRARATQALTNVESNLAAQCAAQLFRDMDHAQNDPTGVLAALGQTKEGLDPLATSIAAAPPSAEIAKRLLRGLYALGRYDARLVEVLSTAAGLNSKWKPPTDLEIAQMVADVSTHGDPERGERVFRGKEIGCLNCHSLHRAGGQVGPDLSAVGGSSPLEYIVASILDPNRAIKEQYVTRQFSLVTGKVHTGVVIDRDEVRVNVRDVQGQIVAIPTVDIEEESAGPSMMPQGVTRFLTRNELLDLCRFVSELGRPGRYAVPSAKTIQRWRVLINPRAESIHDVPHLEHLRQYVFDIPDSQWRPAYARVDGFLPLEDLTTPHGSRITYLYGEIDVSREGLVEVRVDTSAQHQLWIASDEIDETTPGRPVAVGTGRHRITLRIELSDATDRQVRVELLPPAESSIQFEVVAGA